MSYHLRRTPWKCCVHMYAVVSYRRLSPQFQFSLSTVTLVYLSQWSLSCYFRVQVFTNNINVNYGPKRWLFSWKVSPTCESNCSCAVEAEADWAYAVDRYAKDAQLLFKRTSVQEQHKWAKKVTVQLNILPFQCTHNLLEFRSWTLKQIEQADEVDRYGKVAQLLLQSTMFENNINGNYGPNRWLFSWRVTFSAYTQSIS